MKGQGTPIKNNTLSFQGKIHLICSDAELAAVTAGLNSAKILGFDTETKPAFRKGEFYPVALLQLSTPEVAYLFRLNKIGLPKSIVRLFENPNISIVGIGIRDDIKDLKKLRDFEPKGFVDLNELGSQLGFESIGARNFSGMFMKHRISKSQQVSNWENPVLTDSQIRYAATDAWICLEIYEKMCLIEKG